MQRSVFMVYDCHLFDIESGRKGPPINCILNERQKKEESNCLPKFAAESLQVVDCKAEELFEA